MEQFLSKVLMICLILVLLLGAYFLYLQKKDSRYQKRRKRRPLGYQPPLKTVVSHHRMPQKESMKTKVMPFMMLDVQTSKGIHSIPLVDNGSGFTIGSSEKCQLVIPKSESEFVGREHAYIYLDEASSNYILEDLDSMNGIYCVQEDGQVQRVSQIELHSDMQFYIADVLVVIRQNNPFAAAFQPQSEDQRFSFEKAAEHFQKV